MLELQRPILIVSAISLLIVLDVIHLHSVLANELKDYCSMHRFENLPGGLRFTKEVVTTEYASVGSFKAIHCCLRGYRSIEWTQIDLATVSSDDVKGLRRHQAFS
ncbi:uncharacterized protein LOC107274788 isoform X2 [Cephus cinctus]|uniref:Uncharacterized protein LOC107274788 isoform X2 n=1 Tax=Cephus cinctus TaxID=211228 RepID=A0AAJ7CG69_CEPCN|nr:uncharacterized protein LOC107274788 isoform X2 [Cephus cinctus]